MFDACPWTYAAATVQADAAIAMEAELDDVQQNQKDPPVDHSRAGIVQDFSSDVPTQPQGAAGVKMLLPERY